MVVDSSAVVAILLDEPERPAFIEAIGADPVKLMSVVGLVETSFVMLSRKREAGLADLKTFLLDGDIERIQVDERQAELAVDAFRLFGKGRHSAALNIGDCFAYALAKSTGEKLLFKGEAFARTDIVPALSASS